MPLQADELKCSLLAILVLPTGRRNPADPVRFSPLFDADNLHDNVLPVCTLWESQPRQLLFVRRSGVGPNIRPKPGHALDLAVRLDEIIPQPAVFCQEVALPALDLERRPL